ncbi:MAG: TP53 regulating kinase [Marteilia pararefringens]
MPAPNSGSATQIALGPETKLYHGAEAILTIASCASEPMEIVKKERIKKNYRLDSIDKSIRRRRTKKESKALQYLQSIGVNVPKLVHVDFETYTIYMEYLKQCQTVKNFILERSKASSNLTDSSLKSLYDTIGSVVAELHTHGFIHGDLTGSNLLLDVEYFNQTGKFKIFLVDFGLSSRKVTTEECAVDLYILERSLAFFDTNSVDLFEENLMKSYCEKYGNETVKGRLSDVRQRGRKKSMIG